MEDILNFLAEKRIKDIKGFYTHLFATFLILPFIIFINLQTVPQFEWYWYAIIAWFLGLIVHWVSVFTFSNLGAKQNWENQKIFDSKHNKINLEKKPVDDEYIQEKSYLKAKKEAQEIKGFYVHLFVHLFSFPLIVFVNLKFVPEFHFFWFALGGMIIALFFHWLGVFGFNILGFGKEWENRKREEIIKKYK